MCRSTSAVHGSGHRRHHRRHLRPVDQRLPARPRHPAPTSWPLRSAVLLLVSVLVHELAHAIVAKPLRPTGHPDRGRRLGRPHPVRPAQASRPGPSALVAVGGPRGQRRSRWSGWPLRHAVDRRRASPCWSARSSAPTASSRCSTCCRGCPWTAAASSTPSSGGLTGNRDLGADRRRLVRPRGHDRWSWSAALLLPFLRGYPTLRCSPSSGRRDRRPSCGAAPPTPSAPAVPASAGPASPRVRAAPCQLPAGGQQCGRRVGAARQRPGRHRRHRGGARRHRPRLRGRRRTARDPRGRHDRSPRSRPRSSGSQPGWAVDAVPDAAVTTVVETSCRCCQVGAVPVRRAVRTDRGRSSWSATSRPGAVTGGRRAHLDLPAMSEQHADQPEQPAHQGGAPTGAAGRRGPFAGGRPGAADRPQGPAAHDHAHRRASSSTPIAGSSTTTHLIGAPEGSIVRNTAGVEYLALRPLLADYVLSMPRGAAVVYPKDAGQIVAMADIFPGARVVEAGVGSGALTMSLLRAVGDQGIVALRRAPGGLRRHRPGQRRGFFGGPHPAWPLTVGDLVESLPDGGREPGTSTASSWTCWRRGSASTSSADALAPGGVLICYVATATQLSRVAEAAREPRRLHRAAGLGVAGARLAPRGPGRPSRSTGWSGTPASWSPPGGWHRASPRPCASAARPRVRTTTRPTPRRGQPGSRRRVVARGCGGTAVVGKENPPGSPFCDRRCAQRGPSGSG